MEETSAELLKTQGNNAVKNEKYEEAILHYTHAIKLDQNNFTLHSNRSFAFLKVQQYYLALDDANEAIRLNPTWPKANFRKAEVEFATKHFTEAFESYQKALSLKPDDENLIDALNKTKCEILREKWSDEKIPWLGAGIGLVIGVIIVISDYIFTLKPSHPLLMSFVTIFIAMVGYGVAKTYRYYVKCQRVGMLEAPPSLDNEDTNEETKKTAKMHSRYTKSQARQRFKKGKM